MKREILITAPGFYPEITCEQYFAEPCPAPALTCSGIKMLAPAGAAPARFAHQHPAIGQPAEKRESTVAQYRGKLVHRLALGKGQEYAVSPHEEWRSKEAKAWKEEAEAAGVMPVKPQQFEEASEMAAAVQRQIDIAVEGREYQTEVVIAWIEEMSQGPVWCRAMLDVWCPELLLALDVKTTGLAITDDKVESLFANSGYAIQHCFYQRGIETLTGEHGRARFRFLFVETEPPFLSRIARASEGYRHAAEQDVRRGLAIFSDCLSRGAWPGYEEIEATPPAWLINRWGLSELLEAAE